MDEKDEIFAVAQARALVCAKHPKIHWVCSCGINALTYNRRHALQCSCNRWMKWRYPLEAAQGGTLLQNSP